MYYRDDIEPFLEIGRKLFCGNAEFIWAASSIKNLPPIDRMEIAFAGRSNVGKSSIINALTGRSALARTSHTPGRTQQLNFFNVGGHLNLVDMPGYGYAAVSKEKVLEWTDLIHDYLRGRSNLGRVYLLIDSRRGLKDIDGHVLETLDKSAVSYQLVLTKVDELKESELNKVVEQVQQALSRRPAAFPHILATSSKSGTGLAEFRAAIVKLMQEQGENVK